MSTPVIASSIYTRKRMIGSFLVMLGGLWCLANLYSVRNFNLSARGVDFRGVYGSSRCVIAGCNPYYFADIREQFLKQGGSRVDMTPSPTSGPFQPHFVGYPPTALFYFVPFALLRWPMALVVYLCIATVFYAMAVALFAKLCSDYVPIAASACLGIFLAFDYAILFIGQPTLLAASLLCIGVGCLLKNLHPRLGVLSFAFSLVIKPPLGGLFLLYFLLAPSHRKRGWQVLGLTVALCLPPVFWFATHSAMKNWRQDLQTNISSVAAQGNISDPGPRNVGENAIIDLQTVISRYRDEPPYYNHAVWAVSAVVMAVWLYPVLRQRASHEKDLLCLAAIGSFSMIPFYHRAYDSRALLVLFPALALLMQRTVWWSRVATLLTMLVSLTLSPWYRRHTRPANHIVTFFANHSVAQTAVVHVVPLVLLVVTVFYLVVLYVSPPSLALDSEGSRTELMNPYDNSLPKVS